MDGPLETLEIVLRKSITPNFNFIEGYYHVSNQRRFAILFIEYLNQTHRILKPDNSKTHRDPQKLNNSLTQLLKDV